MKRKQLRRNNHYVPRSYLKRWEADDGRVWTYRILVSNSNIPKWKAYSTKGIAYHSHLYTRIVGGEETDEIERWLDSEYENPAEPVIEKILDQRKMSPKDWSTLIKYMASQDVRTPARLLESLKMQEKTMPDIMQSTLEKSVNELETAKKEGRVVKPKRMPNSELIPMRVSIPRPRNMPTITCWTLPESAAAASGLCDSPGTASEGTTSIQEKRRE